MNRILALFAIVAFAHHRHIYWLYCRTGDHHCDDPRTIIDDSGVLYLGRFCTWISSLVRIENSYAWGLAGYTALIIVITIQPEPLLTPQFAVERCSEIVIGIVCAIMADLLFSPRSIKQEVDRELESLLVAQYQLMQLCIKHGDGEVVDKAWGDLVRRTTALQGMRSNLNMESSRWARANRRLKAINTLSLTLITQSCETYLIQNTRPELITDTFREFLTRR